MLIENDGRQNGYSLGLRHNDCDQLAKELDLKNAFIVDGGGSATMIALAENGYKLVNRPCDKDSNGNYGATRTVVNSVILSYGKDRNAPAEEATSAPTENNGGAEPTNGPTKAPAKNDKTNSKKIDEALKKADALNLKGRLFYSLSGGERQKVSLARCYCQNAKILLLDEPSSYLDLQSKKTFINQMKKLEQEDFSVIAVTHDEEIIKELNWKTVRFFEKEKSIEKSEE